MSALAVALRVARRDARRAKGRSALVLAMVALPVLGVTAADVLVRTYQLDGPQRAQRSLGAADIAVSATGFTSVQQAGSAEDYSVMAFGPPAPAGGVDPASVLPAGSRTVLDRTVRGRVAARGQVAPARLRELAYRDPVAAGLYHQSTGRAPTGPGEVALTDDLAERLGVRAGNVVELPREGAPAAVTVVGTVADGDRTDTATVLLGLGGPPAAGASTRLLVDLPTPLTWDLVRAANARGVEVHGRGAPVPGEPPASPTTSTQATTVTGVGLVVGMALLEVVLLAGPAFAVGAKRQERVLALLRTSGADRRDVRRTVLAGGLVLGTVAGVVGALGGVGLAAAGLPLVRRSTAQLPGPFDVRPPEVLALAVLGVLTAVLAALLPALSAARQDVLAGLTGRRGVRRTSLRVPAAGLALAAAGTLLALQGARHRSVDTVLAGAALAELGLVATTPALVGLAGRLGPLLPAAPRLALRDAARHRSRTAPAVAAVLAAVAGSVAVATFVSSRDRDNDQRYQPSAAPGAVTVDLPGEDARRAPEVVAALARTLPGSRPAAVRVVGPDAPQSPSAYVDVEVPAERACPAQTPGTGRRDPSCLPRIVASALAGGPVVGGPDVARALIGPVVPTAILDRGGALVEERAVRPDGTAVVVVHTRDALGDHPRRVRVPAAALPAAAPPQVVLSEAAARTTGVPLRVTGVAALPGSAPSTREEDLARGAVLAVAPHARLDVERGYQGAPGGGLLALLCVSALLVLGASGIATGLAAADGRADLSTLAAVGASPGLRRRLAAAQSVVTAGLGTVLGAAAGLVPAVGLIRAINAVDSTGYQRPVPFPVVLPWTSIAVTVVVVPLLAGLLAALLTRSRLPLLRRLV